MYRRALAVLLATLAVVGVACSSDKNGDKEPNATGPSSSTTELSEVPTTFTGGDKSAFCAAFVEMELPKNKHLAGGEADQIRAYYRNRARFLVRMRVAASDEIRASVVNHIYWNSTLIKSGRVTDLADDRRIQNDKIVYGYARAQCGIPEPTPTTAPSR